MASSSMGGLAIAADLGVDQPIEGWDRRSASSSGSARGAGKPFPAPHGPNALTEARGRSVGSIIVGQFKSLIVALLVAATAVAFVLGEIVEAVAILVVIFVNAAVGFWTEWRAEQALTALQRQAVAQARVLRDGAEHVIAAADLVPGDVVLIDAGARVPADGRVIQSAQLQVAEAALTGESLPITKTVEPIADAGAALGDRRNMAHLGTAVTHGRGRLLVTATGMRTEVGRIGALMEAAGGRETPLERKLAQLGHALAVWLLTRNGL